VATECRTLFVENALEEPALASHPAVRELGVVAYAGVPLGFRGEGIGAFCVIDHTPRQWSALDMATLKDLAALVLVQVDRDTARKELEGSLQTLRNADRRKNEFLATLAHELRNPIAPIRTSAHLLRQAVIDNPIASQSAAIIERQVKVMRRLVDDLLDINRIERDTLRLERRRVLLDEVLDSAVESILPELIDRGLHLVQHRETAPVWLEADPMRLAQVLVNLLGNEAKFTVEMFAQTGSATNAAGPHGGLGIGLALSRRLVELHGGTLVAASEGTGRGSTFTVEVPHTVRPTWTRGG
jgi:signal transduction histidine kinase